MTSAQDVLQTPTPGTMFGRYRVVRKLGQGGMGVVYEAEHSELGKRVALKTLRAHLAGDRAVVERFVREGHAAARIRHPHVVNVTDVGTARGVPFLVMELLEGETLAARIKRGPMAPDEVAAVMLPVCAAVAAAHARGVLHRDLKPDNIFLERAPRRTVRPKVLDFGIAKILDDAAPSLTHTAAVLGTPFYMSPEQARGAREIDARSDQYALGVIVYECSTGQRPFAGASLLAVVSEINSGVFPPPRALRPSLSEDFDAVVLRAMAHDPAARFGMVSELGAALLPFASDRTRMLWIDAFHPPSDPPPSIPEISSLPAPPIVPPVLAETMGDPRPLVNERIPTPTPIPTLRTSPPWRVAVAGLALVTLAAYLFTHRSPTPARALQPVATTVIDAPLVDSAGGRPAYSAVVPAVAAVAPTAEAATVLPPPARPAQAPAHREPAGGRHPTGRPGQREIPME